jgi:hypothetical protein
MPSLYRHVVSRAGLFGYVTWDAETGHPLSLAEFGRQSDGLSSRACLIGEVFSTMVPQCNQVTFFMAADFKIIENYDEAVRLRTFDDETMTWKQVVPENPHDPRTSGLQRTQVVR